MARDFRFLTTRPAAGWTAQTLAQPKASVVGDVNAAAQNNVTADALKTTPSTLADSGLGSRRYQNPNTGIRDVAAAGSVYAQSDVPAFLSQAVSALNSEQALQRSLQAEWNNKLMMGALGQYGAGSADPYVWMEALRAASVGPGSSVAFGQAIQDPNQGRAAVTQAYSDRMRAAAQTNLIHQALGTNYRLQTQMPQAPTSSGWRPQSEVYGDMARRADLNTQASFISPLATAAAGGLGPSSSGWYSSPNRATISNLSRPAIYNGGTTFY